MLRVSPAEPTTTVVLSFVKYWSGDERLVAPPDDEPPAIRRRKMTGKLPDVTDGTFQSEVLESEQPVLVDFWAPWCGPCRVVHPILEEMSTERDDFRIVSMNTDENQGTAAKFEILSIPTLILFKDGAEAKRVIGAMPKRRLEAELEPVLA
jgi:thioredoxin 1